MGDPEKVRLGDWRAKFGAGSAVARGGRRDADGSRARGRVGGRIFVSGFLARGLGDRRLGVAAAGRRRALMGSHRRRCGCARRSRAVRSPRRGDPGLPRARRGRDRDGGAQRSSTADLGGRRRRLRRSAGCRGRSAAREFRLWPRRDPVAFRRGMGHRRHGLFWRTSASAAQNSGRASRRARPGRGRWSARRRGRCWDRSSLRSLRRRALDSCR